MCELVCGFRLLTTRTNSYIMAQISLSFKLRSGRLYLYAYTHYTKGRNYLLVQGLVNPDYKCWDEKNQLFISADPAAKANNVVLFKLLQEFTGLLEHNKFQKGTDLFNYYIHQRSGIPLKEKEEQEQEPEQAKIQLGNWVAQIIDELRNPTKLKPSTNYRVYRNLLRKLIQEGKLIRMPVDKIDDSSFKQLADWVNATPPSRKGQGNGLFGIIRTFKAVMNKARRAKLTTYEPSISILDYAPVVDNETENAKEIIEQGGIIKSLTKEQYEHFLNFDLSKIEMRGLYGDVWHKELYRDFCILLYEMKSRPIDIAKMHSDNIALDHRNNRFTCTYIPSKKKNYMRTSRHGKNPLVIQTLSPKALEIINKYKGKSKGGYIIPFEFNNKKWNLSDAKQFNQFYIRQNKICGRINVMLSKIGKQMGLPFSLSLYVFRRTAITQAIIENKIPLPILAKIAGTSVDMIDKHYANYLQALEAY